MLEIMDLRQSDVSPAEEHLRARRSAVAFWTVAVTNGLVLAGNSTPSPLYVDYQARWGFSSATLTVIYGIYAGGVLLTLLLAGGLSDRIGRRPVLLGGLVVLLISYAVFLVADGVQWLYVARALQGLGTGLFTGAAGAALADLHPRRDSRTAGMVNSASMATGIAAGAVLSSALAQWLPHPLLIPFLVLSALSLVFLTVIALRVPETVAGARVFGGGLIRPQRLRVPAEVRRPFTVSCLGVIASWAVGGLYLGLGGSIAKELLHSTNHLVTGLAILAMQGVGGIAQLVWSARSRSPSNLTATEIGCLALIVGMVVCAISLPASSAPAFFGGAVVTGVGFGLTFMGATRTITHAAPIDRRGETLAAYFVVAYLAISVPVVVAGLLAGWIGLRDTFYLFVAATVVLSAVTAGCAPSMSRATGPAAATT